jgi:hypothetical protein
MGAVTTRSEADIAAMHAISGSDGANPEAMRATADRSDADVEAAGAAEALAADARAIRRLIPQCPSAG